MREHRVGSEVQDAGPTAIVIGALSAVISVAPRAHAGTPAPLMSPEEAAIHLIPYEMTSQDLPSSYKLSGDPNIGTAATSAFGSIDPWGRFNSETNGGRSLDVSQEVFVSAANASPAGQQASFNLSLFDTTQEAKAYAAGQALAPPTTGIVSYAPVTVNSSLG